MLRRDSAAGLRALFLRAGMGLRRAAKATKAGNYPRRIIGPRMRARQRRTSFTFLSGMKSTAVTMTPGSRTSMF